MKAYKYVEPRWVKSILAGRLLIRSLAAYADLENSLADDLEGSVRFELKGSMLVDPGTREARIARRMGFVIGPNAFGTTIAESSTQLSVELGFAFCMGNTPDNAYLRREGRRAIIEIADVEALADRLQAAHPFDLGQPTVGRVQYEERVFPVEQVEWPAPSALIKRPEFAMEDELRIIWPAIPPAPPASLFAYAPDIAPLLRLYA